MLIRFILSAAVFSSLIRKTGSFAGIRFRMVFYILMPQYGTTLLPMIFVTPRENFLKEASHRRQSVSCADTLPDISRVPGN